MKKIFSMLLATALLFGMLLPMSVSADAYVVNPTGTTEILLPNFAVSAMKYLKADGTTKSPTSNTYPLGSIYTKVDGVITPAGRGFNATVDTAFKDDADVVAMVYDVPVTVTTAGTYTVTLLSSTLCSNIRLVVDGNEYTHFNYTLLDGGNSAYTGESWTYCNSSGNASTVKAAEYRYKVPFTQGENTITLKVPKDGLTSAHLCGLSFRKETAIVDSNSVTTVEIEDFANPGNLSGDARFGVDGSVAGTDLTTYFKNKVEAKSAYWYDVRGTVLLSDNKRAFFLKKNEVYANSYPYSVKPRSVTAGTAIKKLVDGEWIEYTPTAEDVATVQYGKADGTSSNYIVPPNNPMYQESLDIQIPIQVTTAGTYQLDLMCLMPYFNNANAASTIDLYVGDSENGEWIGKVHRRTGETASYPGAAVAFETETATINTRTVYPYLYSNYYFSQVVSSSTYTSPIARYVFEAELDPSDTYITIAVNPMGMGSFSERAADIDATYCTIIDSLTITGANAASNAISTSSKTGTVIYGATERALGKAVLALYNDEQLVAVEKWDATMGEAIMNLTTTYAGEFDAAKVFIWEDFENCLPKVVAKELTLN